MSIYGWFSYLGLMAVSASLLVGFRHDAAAPPILEKCSAANAQRLQPLPT